MEELLKVGEKTSKLDEEVELTDFEKRLNFTKGTVPEFTDVIPKPAFCVKTKHLKPDAVKVFLNICSADCVPKPPPITDDELRRRVEEAERDNLTVSYRLPMSLGELRIDKDNKGNAVDVYDIVVNEEYLKKLESDQCTYQIGFLVSVALQGLEEKYSLDLDRNWIMLKNRKNVGQPAKQRIRKKSKNPNLEEVVSKGEIPEDIKLYRSGQKIHASMKMKNLDDLSNVTLEINPDSIRLAAAPSLYFTELWLENIQLDHDRASASFDHHSKILSIVAPVF